MEKLLSDVLALLLLLWLAGQTPAMAKTQLELRFEKVNCTIMRDDYIDYLMCSTGKSAKRPSMTLEVRLKQDVPTFHFNSIMTLPHKGGDRVLFNLTNISGCDLIAGKNQILIVQLAVKQMFRYSNIPHKCPFPKDKLFYIRNYHFDMNQLSFMNFETAVNLEVEYLYNNMVLLHASTTMRTRRKQIPN